MLFALSTQIALQASILLSNDYQIPLRAQDMAATLGVTPSHLNRVLHELKRSGLVRVVRGPCGGVALTRSPKLISVWEVLVAMEPVEGLENCVLGLRRCSETSPCALHEAWAPIRTQLLHELRNRTLKQAAEEAQRTHFAGFGEPSPPAE